MFTISKGMEGCREFLEPMLLVTLFAPASQLSAAAALAALYYFVLAHQVRCHQIELHQNLCCDLQHIKVMLQFVIHQVKVMV